MQNSLQFETAMQLIRNGQLDNATLILRQLIQADPNSVDALRGLAIIALQSRSFQEAAQLFERVISISPTDAGSLANLSMAYLELQKYSQAIECCERSLQLRPDNWQVLFNLALIYQECDRLELSQGAYKNVLRINPKNIQAKNNLGLVLKSQGKFQEAVHWLQSAIEDEPGYYAAWSNLGQVYCTIGEFELAVKCGTKAIESQPNDAYMHQNLSLALLGNGQYSLAEEAIKRAIAFSPSELKFLVDLGNIYVEQDRFLEARECFQRSLELAPRLEGAALGLGILAAFDGNFGAAKKYYRDALAANVNSPAAWYQMSLLGDAEFSDSDFNVIKQLSDNKRQPPSQRQFALFALGNVLERRSEYDAAYDAFRHANQLSRTKFDPDKHDAWIEDITQTFDSQTVRQLNIEPAPKAIPLFIFGMPRAGTTLVEQILASHPLVVSFGEVAEIGPFLQHSIREQHIIATGDFTGYPELFRRSRLDLLRQLRSHFFTLLAPRIGENAYFTDKTPANFLYLGLIACAFPEAKLIHIQREPIDVCLSCYTTHFQHQDFTSSLEHIARYYLAHRRLMEHWQKVLPGRIHTVRYEELVDQAARVSQNLVRYCELPQPGESLPHNQIKRPIITASAWQARQPISRNSVGRWRNYESQLQPLLALLNDIV